MTFHSRTLLSATIGSLLGINVSAQERVVLEEIVVTAQKRSESLQLVPVAVSAYTSEMRDVLGVLSVPDITDFTPGMSFSSGLDRMSVRGVGRLTNNHGSDPGVANYTDGFYTASTVEAGKRPILIDRVEVLRGPQGTLYGRNSVGGAINIVSKRPTDTFTGEVRATVGNYDSRIIDAAVSGPITDWLRYRVAGTAGRQDEGFYKDVDGDSSEGGVEDDRYLEAQLEFDIGESVDGWMKYSQSKWDRAGRSLVTITPYDIAPLYFSGLFPNTSFNGTPTQPVTPRFTEPNPSMDDPRLYDTDTPSNLTLDDSHTYVLELIGHAPAVDIKYVGGYQAYTMRLTGDLDGIDRDPFTTTPPTPAGTPPVTFTIYPTLESFYMEDKEYYSNEINLISTHDGPLQWLFGLYQFHEQVNQNAGARAPLQPELSNPRAAPPTAANGFNPPAGPANPDRNLQISGAFLESNSRAVFGQVDYSFTESLKLTLGARYSEDEKEAEEYRTRVVFGVPGRSFAYYSASTVDGVVIPEIDRRNQLSGEWHATSGTAALQWVPTSDTLVFAKYSRGYKSGGFNAGAFAPDGSGYTEPEFIDAYEIGLKQTFLKRLTTNLSLFYYDYKDAQYPSIVRDPASNLNQDRFINLDRAISQGAELELIWAVTDAWQMRLSYGYLDTEIQDGRCFIDNADVAATAVDARPCSTAPATQRGQRIDGNPLPSAPENKLAFNTNYTWRLPAGLLTLSGSWTYRDETYYAVFARDHYLAPAYDETNLRVLWNDLNRKYTVIAFVRNAFDDENIERVDASQSIWGARSLQIGLRPPRTYGLEVQFRFGT